MKTVRFISIVIIIAAAVILRLSCDGIPEVEPADAPRDRFSADRAFMHTESMARMPHPSGSDENRLVRDYIVSEMKKNGCEVSLQKTDIVHSRFPNYHIAGYVENIIARIPGTDPSGAVLIMAHYDSVTTGPGASDDLAAAAAMIESARALKLLDSLKNDILFLFTDGEEVGLLGAVAFLEKSPLMKEVSFVINLEARGTAGASMLFETGNNNGGYTAEFIHAAPHPVGNSLSDAAYDFLPNDTDFTVYKEKGLPGLNFAFIENSYHYHTMQDSIDNLDRRSLQHHGSHVLHLARHFGENLREGPDNELVYFTLIGNLLVRYPETVSYIITALLVIAILALVAYGLKRNDLSARGAGAGMLFTLMVMVTVPTAVFFLWKGILLAHQGYRWMIMGEVYNTEYYRIAISALALLIAAVAYSLFRRRFSFKDIYAGSLLFLLLPAVLATIHVNGSVFIFQWPLIFSAAILASAFIMDRGAIPRQITAVLLAVPVLLLGADMVKNLYTGLTVSMGWVVSLVTVVFFVFLLPLADFLLENGKRYFFGIAAVALIACLAAGGITGGFSEHEKKPNSISYMLNADTSEAIWFTCDPSADEWTSQFFSDTAERKETGEVFPLMKKCIFSNRPFLIDTAPATRIDPPEVTITADTGAGERIVRFSVIPRHGSSAVIVFIKNDESIKRVFMGEDELERFPVNRLKAAHRLLLDRLDHEGYITILFNAPSRNGVPLAVYTDRNKDIEITCADITYGTPAPAGVTIRERSDYMMPSPGFFIKDSTMVTRNFRL